MIREHDRVVLTAPVPDERLEIGDVGTVVHAYQDGKAFEVEFTTTKVAASNSQGSEKSSATFANYRRVSSRGRVKAESPTSLRLLPLEIPHALPELSVPRD
jgi:hypothetical protein